MGSDQAWGVQIEGININGAYDRATVFLLGSSSGGFAWPSAGGTSYVVGRALLDAPSLSASKLDPLTGEVSSGGAQVQLHATPELGRLLLGQARARLPDAVLLADVTNTDVVLDLDGVTLVAGDMIHLAEEVVYLSSSAGGTLWNVVRGYSDTRAQAHLAGRQGYRQPPVWAGRAVTVYKADLNVLFSPTTLTPVWRGFLTEAPGVGNSVTTISLRADDALNVLRRAAVNRTPLRHSSSAPVLTYFGTKGVQIYCDLPPEGDRQPNTGVRKLSSAWLGTGRWKAIQLADHLVLTRNDITATGFPIMGSPQFEGEVVLPPPFWEVALWSPEVDEWIAANYPGEPGVSPTLSCDYPYHPLTIAAALLFSTQQDFYEDPAAFDVMHPQFALGADFLADFAPWFNLIAKTSHLRVDRCLLGASGRKEDVFRFVTQELLPAYGFALTSTSAGLLAPVEVGLADIGTFAAAPQTTPVSGRWDWTLGVFGALDSIEATVGALPWAEGRSIEVTGEGVRTSGGSGRASRILSERGVSVTYPTIAFDAAESFGATTLLNRLVWRYDGLPMVGCWLQASRAWRLGEWVRLLKPAGLETPILFDSGGNRVDNLWDTAALIGQIVSLRLDLRRNRYEVELLLTNYSYGAAARWRAPAARIKSRTGIGLYIVEGTTSDFDEATSDALSLAVGDDLILANKSLGIKSGSLRSVVSITPSGADWLVTLNADFGVAGVAGDWLYLGTSAQYSNNSIVSGESFPYVFMTTAATLTRPGPTTGPPDDFS